MRDEGDAAGIGLVPAGGADAEVRTHGWVCEGRREPGGWRSHSLHRIGEWVGEGKKQSLKNEAKNLLGLRNIDVSSQIKSHLRLPGRVTKSRSRSSASRSQNRRRDRENH